MQVLINSLLRTVPIGIGISVDRVIVEANDALARLMGYAREELIGSSTRVFYRSDAEFKAARMSVEGAYPVSGDTQWRRKNGSLVDVNVSASPTDPQDLAKGIVFAVVDLTERKRTEEALRESEERFRSLSSAACEGIMIHEHGVILDVNPELARFFGYEQPEELIGKNGLEFMLTSESRVRISRRIERRETGRIEVTCVRQDGSTFEAELDSRPVKYRGHDATVVAGRCITERKRAEADLQEIEERYRALFDRSLDCVFLSDFDGRFLDANQAALDLLGYRREEIVTLTFQSLLTDDQLPLAQRRVEQILAAGYEQSPSEYWLRRKDGGGVLVETQASLIYRTGKPFAIQGIARDITARKWTEEALWKSHARFDQLAEQSRTITWEVDTKGLYTFVSRVSEAIWGYLPAELVGRMHFYDLHPEEGRGEFKQAALAVFEQKKPFESLENATLAKDGRVVWVSTNGIPLLNAEGILQGYRGSDTDITVRKRAEEEKTKLQAQLHQAQKMECIGRLAGGVAHDFNNLLTVINGYSLLGIANLRPCDPLRTSLEEIHKAGERAAGLTRQLLAFSRKQVLQPRVLNLDCLLQEIRSMLERLVGEDVRVHLALGAESGTVRADLHQLEQVILNLVVNARDAMLDGGTLLIETAGVERDESHVRSHPEARAGRYIMLAVSDNGTGMDEATRRQIFEPFFTTKEVGKGTGLGLSMVQGIVAQSGGYVSVYSELGHGTTFTVYLPALAEAMADAAKPSIVPAMGEGQTVLVVEDQAEVREYAATVLKTYGYRVVKAGNAGEALILCEQERGRIHLVLTDVVMPHVSGRELANRLEQLQPGIRVLFMSGYTDEAILHHGVLEEGVAYIQKPFSPDQLAIKVREMLA